MELKETIEMMNSEDYKERFKAEYYQAIIRYRKLTTMIQKLDENKLHFTPTSPRSTYSMQLSVMNYYISILEARAVMEGIDLT